MGRRPLTNSATGRLSQCSLHSRIKRAEKPGPILLGQRSRSASIGSELAQVWRNLPAGKSVTYVRRRPLFSGRGDDARPLLETA